MANIEKIITSLAAIFSVFKRHPKVAEEKAERMDIKNKRRQKKNELRNLRTDKKIKRLKSK